MRTLVVSDLHLSDKPRDAYRLRWFAKRLPEMIERHSVRRLLILGDITEEKDRHSTMLVNQISDSFNKLSLHVEELLILRGNHDGPDECDPFFYFLRYIPRIAWITAPEGRDFNAAPADLGTCLFLPHTRDHERDWQGFSFKGYEIIFAHATFDGARTETGRRLEGVSLSLFPRKCRIISGDIHRPQTLGCATYVGAPYTVDFGDDYEARVLLLMRRSAQRDIEIRSIKCAGPQKRLVLWDGSSELTLDNLSRRDIVKVRVQLKPHQYDQWARLRERVQEWAASNDLVLDLVEPQIEAPRNQDLMKLVATVERIDDKNLIIGHAKKRMMGKATVRTGLDLLARSK